jgi:hypothetical protein
LKNLADLRRQLDLQVAWLGHRTAGTRLEVGRGFHSFLDAKTGQEFESQNSQRILIRGRRGLGAFTDLRGQVLVDGLFSVPVRSIRQQWRLPQSDNLKLARVIKHQLRG